MLPNNLLFALLVLTYCPSLEGKCQCYLYRVTDDCGGRECGVRCCDGDTPVECDSYLIKISEMDIEEHRACDPNQQNPKQLQKAKEEEMTNGATTQTEENPDAQALHEALEAEEAIEDATKIGQIEGVLEKMESKNPSNERESQMGLSSIQFNNAEELTEVEYEAGSVNLHPEKSINNKSSASKASHLRESNNGSG